MPTPERYLLPASAYEVIVGDRIDDREVTGVDDPDRPEGLIKPLGPGEVTVTFADGDPLVVDRMSAVEISRDAAVVQARMGWTEAKG